MANEQSDEQFLLRLCSNEAKQNRKRTDMKTEVVRDLFELVAFYAIVWGAALSFVLAVTHCIAWFCPTLPAWFGWIGLGATLSSAAGAFIFFGSSPGKRWEERVRLWAKQYGYPITLLIGVGLALVWESTTGQQTDQALARRAAMEACRRIPYCIRMAEGMNQGNDVLTYLPR
jgi:cytochrome c biogenesis protein CcdA